MNILQSSIIIIIVPLLNTVGLAQRSEGVFINKEVLTNIDTSITINQISIGQEIWNHSNNESNSYTFMFQPYSEFSNSYYPEIIVLYKGNLVGLPDTRYAYVFKENQIVTIGTQLPKNVSPKDVSIYLKYVDIEKEVDSEKRNYSYLRLWKAISD